MFHLMLIRPQASFTLIVLKIVFVKGKRDRIVIKFHIKTNMRGLARDNSQNFYCYRKTMFFYIKTLLAYLIRLFIFC